MNDRRSADRLWWAGLATSPMFRRWTELYPSIEGRLEQVMARASPGLKAAAEKMFERAQENAGPSADADALRRRFDLTEAEAALASALAMGEHLTDYAGRRGVRVQTARNQLQSIFQKVGVNRQSDLVRRLLTWDERPK